MASMVRTRTKLLIRKVKVTDSASGAGACVTVRGTAVINGHRTQLAAKISCEQLHGKVTIVAFPVAAARKAAQQELSSVM